MVSKIQIFVGAEGRGTVIIDGQEIKGITGLNYRVRAGELSTVLLRIVGDVEITGEADVRSERAEDGVGDLGEIDESAKGR